MGKYYQFKKKKTSYLICAVPACKTKKSTTTLKTFEIPSDLNRRNEWIAALVNATLKDEEGKSKLDDLYAVENRRVELEMEISESLGDHSYVCARHFRPEDIVVHPNVCRLTPQATPSVFKNYPAELPKQFFKRICQKLGNMPSSDPVCTDAIITEADSETDEIISLENTDASPLKDDDITPLSPVTDPAFDPFCSSTNSDVEIVMDCGETVRVVPNALQNIKGNIVKRKFTIKKYRALQTRCKKLQEKLNELQIKHDLYNLDSLERDADNNNEEAVFILDMLRSYTVFETTRAEIKDSAKQL